jgi:hypothetical protein
MMIKAFKTLLHRARAEYYDGLFMSKANTVANPTGQLKPGSRS